jgi:hypothetical protein
MNEKDLKKIIKGGIHRIAGVLKEGGKKHLL